MNAIDLLIKYFSYPFVRYALIASVCIAAAASLLGVSLVLKRFSFIGDGLSHVAFGALAVSAVLGVNQEMIVILPITVVSAILILRVGTNRKLNGDAAIAMLSVSALAVGYLLLNLFNTSGGNVAGDVCSSLFGATALITLKRTDVIICVVATLIVIAIFVAFYNRIFAVTFDENFARATGQNTGFYNLLISVITAVIIVLAMKLIGSLLISALIIFPALSAMCLFKNFRSVTIFSAAFAVVCAVLGIIISLLASTPVGATIVCVNLAAYIICRIISAIGNK